MVDDDFGDTHALIAGDRRQEAVHLAVQTHALHDLRAKDLQRAAVVVQVHARNGGDQTVGDHRRQPARDELVLSVLPPAARDVVAALDHLDHRRNVARIVLQIAVRGDDEPSARVIEAGRERRGLAEIAPQPDHPQMRIAGLQLRQDLEALVRAPIVDDDELVRTAPARRAYR